MSSSPGKIAIWVAVIGFLSAISAAYINNKTKSESIVEKTSLNGIVVDEDSRREIQDCEVTIVGTAYTDYSKSNGRFKIEVVKKAEEVEVRFTKKGYKIKTVNLRLNVAQTIPLSKEEK